MADTAPAAAAAAPAQKKAAAPAQKKAAKKPTKAKVPASHPIYKEMVSTAITSLKDRKGSSRQAILKYIMANFKGVGEEKQANVHLKLALKRMAESGYLTHVKGKGAAGSFRVSKAKAAPSKKAAPKKPKAKKSSATKKKPASKKAKKPASKKASKSPAKKAPKKPKKSAAKPVAKKPVAKKPAARKPAKKSKGSKSRSKPKK